ncbi:MAG: hypothetical protein LBS40_03790 [Burkholderiales bacterium]|jgi:hypothetical protein|nr:hypothetical protein [Burkholderiales bacterium]
MSRSFFSRLENLPSAIATLAATALLIVVAVHWGWYFFGPSPLYVVPPITEDPAATLRAATLFGATSHPTTNTETLPVTINGNLRLLGLVAQDDGHGYAVFRRGGDIFVARAGDDIGDGAMLLRVELNAMTIRENDGGERRIILRDERAALPESAMRATQPVALSSSCVPVDFKGVVIRLNSELLQGALTQPEAFYALLDAQNDGLIVHADSGHAAMLGLRGGDKLQMANGVRLRQPEDIGATILRPLAAGQNVHLRGARDGKNVELLLVNASTCGG